VSGAVVAYVRVLLLLAYVRVLLLLQMVQRRRGMLPRVVLRMSRRHAWIALMCCTRMHP